jgi:hypothetical protein
MYVIAALVFVTLFLFAPLLEGIARSGQLILWIAVNMPLIPFASNLAAAPASRSAWGTPWRGTGRGWWRRACFCSTLPWFSGGLAGAAWEWVLGRGG